MKLLVKDFEKILKECESNEKIDKKVVFKNYREKDLLIKFAENEIKEWKFFVEKLKIGNL